MSLSARTIAPTKVFVRPATVSALLVLLVTIALFQLKSSNANVSLLQRVSVKLTANVFMVVVSASQALLVLSVRT